MLDLSTPRILTVTELTRSIRGILETEFPFVTVTGEISNLRQPYSGHLYCTLKDEDSQLKAVLFKTQQKYLRELPEEGQKIICRGRISVYEPRGEYQLIIDYIERLGTGELQIAFENLKLKLAREGLFDQEPKKEIPRFPASVALITSPEGAALYDFLKVALQGRCRVEFGGRKRFKSRVPSSVDQRNTGFTLFTCLDIFFRLQTSGLKNQVKSSKGRLP